MTGKVLVTGATGYVGGRLVPRLLEAGYNVRAGGRSLTKLGGRHWAQEKNVELVRCDVLDEKQLREACEGVEIVYFLVHSMVKGVKDFASTDQKAAENMRKAAEEAGVKRIIYLSGLGEKEDGLSHHLKSRHQVGEILQEGKVPVTILRAAMIIGSGSASFEILRYLVQRLPILITPLWVSTKCQPIAVRNVIDYLVGCASTEATTGETFDIGGPDVLRYRDLMDIFAEERGLSKRWIIPVPVFTPKLSSYWIHFVTPVPASIARPLAEGLKTPVLCQENRIRELIPQKLLSCREAIRRSIKLTEEQMIETHWSDAGPMLESTIPGDPNWAGGNAYNDSRHLDVKGDEKQIWNRIIRLGGSSGWYVGNWLWRVRGVMDKLVGGVGLSRGRRNANSLSIGDALDFWRVLDMQPNKRLLLFAEMKLPGRAWLEFKLTRLSPDTVRVEQNAYYVPKGILGLLYWWAVSPFHEYIFDGMLTFIASHREPGNTVSHNTEQSTQPTAPAKA